MLKKIIYLTLILCCFALPAAAQNQSGAFTISPLFGGHAFENDLSLETSPFWGIALGYNLTENWGLEGIYTRTDADADNITAADTKVETYRLDALYHFRPTEKLVPYLALGLGTISSSPDGGSVQNDLSFDYGVGIKYFVLDDLIALRADVRHLVAVDEPDSSLQYFAGLTFQLGKAAPAPVSVPEPAPVIATPAPTPLDSDGDGVFDKDDQCPDTPAGAPVDSKGCPLDSDNDGVFDYLDNCPNTPRRVSVDDKGCPTVLTLHINFGNDSSNIGPKYDNEIAKAAQCINDYPGNMVFIDGHTDSNGATEYNQKLSEQRAAAVESRLIEKFNIPATRLSPRGFGEERPVADNNTAEGRALNRRVEVACGSK